MSVQVDLHGLHVEEALQVLEQHLLTLGGLGCPGGVLLQVRWASCAGHHVWDLNVLQMNCVICMCTTRLWAWI